MKKFFYPLLLLIAMTFALTACEGDELVIPNPTISAPAVNEEGFVEVTQEDTLVLQAAEANASNCTYRWYIDNQEVFEGPTYKFVPSEAGEYVIVVKATNDCGVYASTEIKILVGSKYKDGTFVLNEGNFSTDNGKLTFISPKGVVTDSAYFKANGSHLGHSSQDLFIADGKMYIISQDNNLDGDGILVVANAETLKKEAAYTKELESLSSPTHIVVIGNAAYIRDGEGIHLFNLDTKEVSLIEGTEAAGSYNCKNRMAKVGNKVYALGGNDLLVLENGSLLKTLPMEGKISGAVAGANDVLWVALDKQPATIVKINTKDDSVMASNELDKGGLSAGWGATPAISAKGDTIYFSNNSTTIYRHIFSENNTEEMVNVSDHIADANMVYNNLAVHPETGDVYFTTIKGYGLDYLINDISVFNFDKSDAPIADYKNHTSFPAGVFFTASF